MVKNNMQIHYRPSEKAIAILKKKREEALKVRPKEAWNTTLDEIIIRSK